MRGHQISRGPLEWWRQTATKLPSYREDDCQSGNCRVVGSCGTKPRVSARGAQPAETRDGSALRSSGNTNPLTAVMDQGLRLGELGMALLRNESTLRSVDSLVVMTGHLRAFSGGDRVFQREMRESWERAGFRSPAVVMHTWQTATSGPSWWHKEHAAAAHNHEPSAARRQHSATTAEDAVASSVIAPSLMAYQVEGQGRASVPTLSPLRIGRHCLPVVDPTAKLPTDTRADHLKGWHGMLASTAMQLYALARGLALLDELYAQKQGTPGLPPDAVVLKTRPDVLLLPRHSAAAESFLSTHAAQAIRGSGNTRQVWTCKGWHARGVSDVAWVTSYEGLAALVRAHDCCFLRLLEKGVLPCDALLVPEIRMKMFFDALGFQIHNGAFDLRWCRTAEGRAPPEASNFMQTSPKT